MRYMNENNTDDYYKILYKARYYYTQMKVMSPARFYKLIKNSKMYAGMVRLYNQYNLNIIFQVMH